MHYIPYIDPGTRAAALPAAVRAVGGGAMKLVVTLLAVSLLVFALTELPGDPARRTLGEGATPAQVAIFNHDYGLDKPFLTRYADWLEGAVQGDFGRAVRHERAGLVGDPAASHPLAAARRARLALDGARRRAARIALGAARRTGRRSSSPPARSASRLSPSSWRGRSYSALFAVRLHWVPANSSAAGFVSNPFDAWSAYLLPAITIAIGGAVHTMRLTRANARDVAGEPYVRAARLRGLGPGRASPCVTCCRTRRRRSSARLRSGSRRSRRDGDRRERVRLSRARPVARRLGLVGERAGRPGGRTARRRDICNRQPARRRASWASSRRAAVR